MYLLCPCCIEWVIIGGGGTAFFYLCIIKEVFRGLNRPLVCSYVVFNGLCVLVGSVTDSAFSFVGISMVGLMICGAPPDEC